MNVPANHTEEDEGSPFVTLQVDTPPRARFRRCVTRLQTASYLIRCTRKENFRNYIKQNDGVSIRAALSRYQNELLNHLEDGKNYLQIACSELTNNTKPKTIKLLLELGFDATHKNDTNGWQALHYATVSKNAEHLKVIIQHLLDEKPEAINNKTNDGSNALLLLLEKTEFDNDSIEIAIILCNANINVNEPNDEQLTPVLYAAYKSYKALLDVVEKSETSFVDIDTHKYKSKTAREWILQNKLRKKAELPLETNAQLMHLLQEKTQEFLKLQNMKQYVNIEQLSYCNRSNLIEAMTFLIENGVDLTQDLKLSLQVTIKCGKFHLLLRNVPDDVYTDDNYDMLVRLCEFAFNRIKDDGYQECFEHLVNEIATIRKAFPPFENKTATALYIKQMPGVSFTHLEVDNENLKELEHFLDEQLEESDTHLTYHYKAVMPIGNESGVFTYLNENSEFHNILLHPLIKMFLTDKVERKHRQCYTILNTYFIIFTWFQLYLDLHLATLVSVFVNETYKYYFCHFKPLKNFSILLIIYPILYIITYLPLLYLVTLFVVIKYKGFPLLILLMYTLIFMYIYISKRSLYHRMLFKRYLLRFIRIINDVKVLIVCFSLTFYYLFGQKHMMHANFKDVCSTTFCENTNNITNILDCSKFPKDKHFACDEFTKNTTDLVSSFLSPCLYNKYKASSKPYCKKLFHEIENKGYPHGEICPSIPFFVHHHSFEQRFCIDVSNKTQNFTKHCLRFSSFEKFCVEKKPVFLDGFKDICESLFCESSLGFTSALNSLLKTIIMGTGEFDSSSLDFSTNRFTPYIFVVFVLCIHVIFLNLLIGLGITDMEGMKRKSEIAWYVGLAWKVKFLNNISHELKYFYYPFKTVVAKSNLLIERKNCLTKFRPFLRKIRMNWLFCKYIPESLFKETLDALDRFKMHDSFEEDKHDNEHIILKKIEKLNDAVFDIQTKLNALLERLNK